ncbi:5233_t:CDS:2, partial [Racocetra persica]
RVNMDQAISEELLDNKLKNIAKTIGETFRDIQGGNVRVVVRASDTELKRHIDKIANEVCGLNREVKRVCFAADAVLQIYYLPSFLTISENIINNLCLGTFTKTEKRKFVQERGIEIPFLLDLTKSSKPKSPEKFLHSLNMNKNANPKEEKVQTYFIDECKALENYVNIQNKLIVRDTHFFLLLDTRKPGFVFILSDSSLDPLSVVAIGEIKNQVGESFSNADIEHAILFGEKILQLQPQRNYISLSKGWRYLVTIMESSPERLRWVEPLLKFGEETVKLVQSIGIDRTSVVERAVLEELLELDSPHILKILFYNENTLVMISLGEKVNNLRKTDIKDIIHTLKRVYSYGYIHRDLQKYNFLRNLDDSKEIIDWGYSTKDREVTAFAGALECMPDVVLKSLINEKNIVYDAKVDLTCFVRSFYLMLHKPSMERVAFDRDDDIKKRAQMLLNFWKDCNKSDVW